MEGFKINSLVILGIALFSGSMLVAMNNGAAEDAEWKAQQEAKRKSAIANGVQVEQGPSDKNQQGWRLWKTITGFKGPIVCETAERFIITGEADGSLKLFDSQSQKCVHSLNLGNPIAAIAVDGSETLVAVSFANKTAIILVKLDIEQGILKVHKFLQDKENFIQPATKLVFKVFCCEDNRKYTDGINDENCNCQGDQENVTVLESFDDAREDVLVWDLQTGTCACYGNQDDPNQLGYCYETETAYIKTGQLFKGVKTNHETNTVREKPFTFGQGNDSNTVCSRCMAERFLTLSNIRRLTADINAAKNKKDKLCAKHQIPVKLITCIHTEPSKKFSVPKLNQVVSAHYEPTLNHTILNIWNTKTAQWEQTLHTQQKDITALNAYLAMKGKIVHLITCSSDGTIKIWENSMHTPLKKCAHCNKDKYENGVELQLCGGCKKVKYCSTECQKADWKKNHKATGCRKIEELD